VQGGEHFIAGKWWMAVAISAGAIGYEEGRSLVRDLCHAILFALAVLLITALSLRALENWQAHLNETRFPDDHI
jgi:hypothetical protein